MTPRGRQLLSSGSPPRAVLVIHRRGRRWGRRKGRFVSVILSSRTLLIPIYDHELPMALLLDQSRVSADNALKFGSFSALPLFLVFQAFEGLALTSSDVAGATVKFALLIPIPVQNNRDVMRLAEREVVYLPWKGLVSLRLRLGPKCSRLGIFCYALNERSQFRFSPDALVFQLLSSAFALKTCLALIRSTSRTTSSPRPMLSLRSGRLTTSSTNILRRSTRTWARTMC